MGLDISHIKATLQRPFVRQSLDLGGVTEETFTGFNVPFEHFHRYIQEIDIGVSKQTVILVKEEKYVNETLQWFTDSERIVIYNDDKQALEKEIKKIEEKNKLTNLDKCFDDSPEKWIILEYYDIVKKKGFYTEEVGYQRKGMNDKFAERFYRYDTYEFALREDFEYAYECVDYYWENDTQENVEQRKIKFKEDFLGKYEFGASYLSISY